MLLNFSKWWMLKDTSVSNTWKTLTFGGYFSYTLIYTRSQQAQRLSFVNLSTISHMREPKIIPVLEKWCGGDDGTKERIFSFSPQQFQAVMPDSQDTFYVDPPCCAEHHWQLWHGHCQALPWAVAQGVGGAGHCCDASALRSKIWGLKKK